MRSFCVASLVLCFVVFLPGRSHAQQDAAPQLQPAFSDEFGTDTRAEYEASGDVTWDQGRLTLNEGALITHEIQGGAWAQVALDLAEAGWPRGGEAAEMRIWFRLTGATDCFLRFRRTETRRLTTALVDTGEDAGQPVSHLVREQTAPRPTVRRIVLTYRNGHITVRGDGEPLLAAFIQNGIAKVSGFSLQAVAGTVDLTGCSGWSVAAPDPLTPQQQQQADRATESTNEMIELFQRAKFSEAAAVGEQTLEVRRKTLGVMHPGYLQSLSNLAAIYGYMAEYGRARELYKQCLIRETASLGPGHPSVAETLSSLAALCESTGEYGQAEKLFRRALVISETVFGEQHPLHARSLGGLASLYQSIGDYAAAEALYRQAIDIRRNTTGPEHPDYAVSLHNLATLYETTGEVRLGRQLLQQAAGIVKAVHGERHPFYATILNQLSAFHSRSGEWDRAEKLLVQANGIIESIHGPEHPDIATGLYNLANLYVKTGRLDQAEPVLQEAMEITKSALSPDHPKHANTVNNLARLYHLTGRLDAAQQLLLEGHRSLLNAARNMLPTMSDAQARRWMAANSPRADACLAILRDRGEFSARIAYPLVWKTKMLISRLRVGQQLSTDASDQAKSLFRQLRDKRLQLARLVAATPAPEQAEQYRAALSAATAEKEVLEKQLAAVNPASRRELAVRDAEIEDLQALLPRNVAVIDFVRLNDWDYDEKEITVLANGQNPEERRVKTEASQPVYDAFLLQSNSGNGNESEVIWIPLGSAEPIEAAVNQWRSHVVLDSVRRGLKPQSEQTATSVPAASPATETPDQVLRRLIWDQLEPHLKDIETVVLIPDAALHRLPWAALPGGTAGSYLIEDYSLGTATSGQQLYGLLSDSPVDPGGGLLVVGGVHYGECEETPDSSTVPEDNPLLPSRSRARDMRMAFRNWRPLAGTAAEAAAVGRLWNDQAPLFQLSGSTASEGSVTHQLPDCRYAHLATHGFFDRSGDVYGVNLRDQPVFEDATIEGSYGSSAAARNPLLLTGLVLGNANRRPETDDFGLPIGEDGLLTAEEILGLPLGNTELVTLSACETALGDFAAGQGVFGLQRSFHQAGARSVIASLWKVDDRATQELMRRFYENLWQKKMGRIAALRAAQLWMLRHPQELEELGIAGAAARGLGGQSTRVDPARVSNEAVDRTAPFFWAAFQLSGDWR
jgi:CHAT domain-containing protein/Tfp pilus assembly protein PilF